MLDLISKLDVCHLPTVGITRRQSKFSWSYVIILHIIHDPVGPAKLLSRLCHTSCSLPRCFSSVTTYARRKW